MIHIFAPKPSARLSYTIDLLFDNLLQTQVEMHHDQTTFAQAVGFRINYSHQELLSDVHWLPHEIMEHTAVNPVETMASSWNHLPVLFPHPEEKWPFDLFAATFFLASRYEEYLPHHPDRHQRFTAEQSIAFNHGFLHRPVINEWAVAFKKLILQYHPDCAFGAKNFYFEATFDIDVAWAYQNKGWWRTGGAFVQDFIKNRMAQAAERWSVIRLKKPDPYDTYAYIRQQTNVHDANVRYFFLLGDYSVYDRNSKSTLPQMQQLIRECADHGNVGIHPSYGSHRSVTQLKKEIERLRKVLGKEITSSRQHYLKMTLPETYRRLMACGIRHDYTMGYAQQPGFRASLCVPYRFFDVEKNEASELWLHPFAYMDGTLQQYQKLSVSEAKAVVKQLVTAVQQVNGHFICLWHNSSLTNHREWSGWREVFEYTLQLSAGQDNWQNLPQ